MRGNKFWTQIGPENEEIGFIGHSLRDLIPNVFSVTSVINIVFTILRASRFSVLFDQLYRKYVKIYYEYKIAFGRFSKL